MILSDLTRELEAVFREPARQLADNPLATGSAARLFLRLHLPLLVVLVLAGFLNPLVRLFGLGGSFSFKLHVLAPLALNLGVLALACVFDQLVQHARHPRMPDPHERPIRNLALYSHLPLSSTAVFFLIHPLPGLLCAFVAVGYCVYQSLERTAELYNFTRARALVFLLNAVLVLLVPIGLLALFFNVLRNVGYLRGQLF